MIEIIGAIIIANFILSALGRTELAEKYGELSTISDGRFDGAIYNDECICTGVLHRTNSRTRKKKRTQTVQCEMNRNIQVP